MKQSMHTEVNPQKCEDLRCGIGGLCCVGLISPSGAVHGIRAWTGRGIVDIIRARVYMLNTQNETLMCVLTED
jgi:hypothetical protein